jgi:all-trans-retinol dehydrogenase (NAD+)
MWPTKRQSPGVCVRHSSTSTHNSRTITTITAELGAGIDILINNAGIVTGAPILQCADSAIERTMQVNALSHFWLIKACLPQMLKAGRGHIVTVASAAGLIGA